MQHPSPEIPEEQPPILGTWKRMYWFVAWFNIALLCLFYALSKWLA